MTPYESSQGQEAAPKPIDQTDQSTEKDLERYGIVASQHTTYEWNGYRYSNSSDEIAAAKRAS